jgi:hypothetical protein
MTVFEAPTIFTGAESATIRATQLIQNVGMSMLSFVAQAWYLFRDIAQSLCKKFAVGLTAPFD